MDMSEVTAKLIEAKNRKRATYQDLAEAVGRNKTWVAAVIQGQASMDEKEAEALLNYLEIPYEEIKHELMTPPYKGSLSEDVPTDPLIYRFHEITQVYGTTLKEIIHEEFGDGIMSAIDFKMDVEREEDPGGDRVVVTLNGKFLPYTKW
ncbi:cyanase [Marinococcus halophilus]|uniref:Cyanate hydratase n=1 Tax=Marinococcus halophilus TaxID=1371 RepID=A0A510Y884_MARHA|nr:cyanase [Marinococcus halophilus]OZT80989.1 cyanase [Marinococcus halophilus]GEK59373.1 cyanate hydratase [Marinococcus halophilus]